MVLVLGGLCRFVCAMLYQYVSVCVLTTVFVRRGGGGWALPPHVASEQRAVRKLLYEVVPRTVGLGVKRRCRTQRRAVK